MIYAFIVATVFITLAELGDKTQLLALALAVRYKAWQVLLGIFVATLAIHLLSTLAGQLIGNFIPQQWLRLVTGLLFVGFGIWTLRGDDEPDADDTAATRFGPILTVGVAFFLAELGDKTQIMTMTLAADPTAVLTTFGAFGTSVAAWLKSMGLSAQGLTPQQVFWGVWLGSTLGMMIADGLAIIVGRVLGATLPERLITRVSGVIFIVFGVLATGAALLSWK